jgi:hypothetical protein
MSNADTILWMNDLVTRLVEWPHQAPAALTTKKQLPALFKSVLDSKQKRNKPIITARLIPEVAPVISYSTDRDMLLCSIQNGC